MQKRFGSKRNAKEEILARYASFIYMGNGQYGFPTAAEYYFGRSLATFTADDADKAALLAGIAKSPRYYAPNAKDSSRVLRRRNQTLALMAANGFIPQDNVNSAEQRPLQVIAPRKDKMFGAPVLGTILQGSEAVATAALKIFCRDVSGLPTVDSGCSKLPAGARARPRLYEKRRRRQRIIKALSSCYGTAMRHSRETGGRQFTRTAPPHTATLTVSSSPCGNLGQR